MDFANSPDTDSWPRLFPAQSCLARLVSSLLPKYIPSLRPSPLPGQLFYSCSAHHFLCPQLGCHLLTVDFPAYLIQRSILHLPTLLYFSSLHFLSVLQNTFLILRLLPLVVGRMLPKDVHALIPGSCDYITLHGKRDFAAAITDFKTGRLAWIIRWTQSNHWSLKSSELPPPGNRTDVTEGESEM